MLFHATQRMSDDDVTCEAEIRFLFGTLISTIDS